MRPRQFIPFILASALAPLPIGAQESFEGTISYRMSGAGMQTDMVHHVRGDQIRVEVATPMGESVMILDANAQSLLMLMPAQKTFMKMDLKSMAAMADQMQPGENAQDAAAFDLTATGKKETIAGHECEQYLMKQGDTEVHLCAATGLGFYMGSNQGMSGPGGPGQQRGMGGLSNAQEAALRERFKDGFLPLKTEVGGMAMEVTSIQKKKIADDLFKVPAGYSEMRM